jgi:multiple sugar transport system permease protein
MRTARRLPSARPTRRRRTRPLSQQESRAGLALISPTLVIVVVVVVVPIAWTVLIAFQRLRLINLRRSGIFGQPTLRNFEQVLTSDELWDAMATTVLYTVASTVLSIGVGLVAALAVRRPFRGRALVRASMLLPYVAPVVAVTFVWEVMLNPQFGIVNDWGIRFLGWDEGQPFLSQPRTALATVIAFETWRYFPFAFLFLLARLQAVPGDLEEAARVDGAAPTQVFRYIVLPQLMPVIAVLSVLRAIFTFNKFDDIYLLTGGGAGTEVVAVRVFDLLTAQGNIGAAAALAVVLAVILAVLVGVYTRMLNRREEAR